jgi:hypothetical protein
VPERRVLDGAMTRSRSPQGEQARACYLPWLKVEGALRYALTFPWTTEAWREVRQPIPWFSAEQSRNRKAGWFT